MGASNDSLPPINRPIAFWGGVLVLGMGVGLTALSVWALLVNHRDYDEAIQAGVPILLEDTGITVMYLAPIAYLGLALLDRKSTRLNSSHVRISYAVFCL